MRRMLNKHQINDFANYYQRITILKEGRQNKSKIIKDPFL